MTEKQNKITKEDIREAAWGLLVDFMADKRKESKWKNITIITLIALLAGSNLYHNWSF
ncbi:MAG: hypothetical protein FWC36_02855 [Spirochaetes bacterium]|nr:hypothetical protein [Spirochaetota bacterium]